MSRFPPYPGSAVRAGLLALAGLAAVGGASASPERAFEGVRERVAERAGESTEWTGVSASAEEIGERLDQLLAGELSADEAAAVALLANRRLQATYAELGIAAADLAQASRLPNPMLDVVALLDDGEVDLIELSLVQELLDAILLPLRKSLAAEAYEIAELRVTREALAVATETRRELYALQADLQTLELVRTALLATEASDDMAESLYQAGNVSRLDRLRERDLLEQTKLQVAEAEMRVLERRERLNRLMGLWGPVTMTWRPAPRLPDPPGEPAPAGDVERRAVENSLELQVAHREVARTARGLGLSGFQAVMPDVELGVAAEGEEGEGSDREWAVGPLVGVPIPIFDQGQAAKARGRAEIRGLWDRYTALAVDVRSAAREAAMRLDFAHRRARYYREVVVPLRQQVTYETQLHYNAMFLGVFQLLEAKRREIDAGLGYIAALRDYWTARADLVALEMGVTPDGMGGMASLDGMSMGMTGGVAAEGDH
jgi:cobalt-zinc-cadmium efflux system outer membrane protein